MRNAWLFVTIVMVGLLLISCGGSEATPASTPVSTPAVGTPATSAIDAGQIYTANCVVCHGANRAGVEGLGPPLTPKSLGIWTDQGKLSDSDIVDIISNGRSGTAMTGFKGRLNAEEIEALTQFIRYTSP